MLDCWNEKTEERPSFTRLKMKLKVLAISLSRASRLVTNTEEVVDEYIEMDNEPMEEEVDQC